VGKPLNYSTTIPAKRTVGECTDLLAEAGADAIGLTYEGPRSARVPTGLRFQIMTPAGPQSFVMPVNIDAVAKLLAGALERGELFRKGGLPLSRYATREHAVMVAWRIIRDWLEAQLAIIDAEMVTLDQVMLPYLQVEGGSLYELVRAQHLALPGGSS
jgi:hypothetical protein